MVSRFAHRIQELAYGGLKPATRAKLDALADGLDPKAARKRVIDRPVVGTRLIREWRSVEQTVTGLADGIEWERRRYKSLSAVARAITSVREENGGAEDGVLQKGDVVEPLGALEPVWDELYPAERARILRLLIERLDVAPDGISVTLHVAGIRSLVAELADQEPPAPVASEPSLAAE
jgi:hypothetical protein